MYFSEKTRRVLTLFAPIALLLYAAPMVRFWLEPGQAWPYHFKAAVRVIRTGSGFMIIPFVMGAALGTSRLVPAAWPGRVRSAVVGGTVLLMLTLVNALPFFFVEPGSDIRPMAWAMMSWLLEFTGLALALTAFAGSAVHRVAALAGVVMCLAPFPLSLFLWRSAAGVLDLTMAH